MTGLVTFTVMAPDSSEPGSVFSFVSYGQQTTMVCPEGAEPGSRIRFTVPHSTIAHLASHAAIGEAVASSSAAPPPKQQEEIHVDPELEGFEVVEEDSTFHKYHTEVSDPCIYSYRAR